jgi:tetratricopeptide (TPR) repeat protein
VKIIINGRAELPLRPNLRTANIFRLFSLGITAVAGNKWAKRQLCPTIILAVVFLVGNIFAADVATDFTAANKLYAEGKFADAAKAYESMLQTGAQSPALLFNCGNAEFKAGNIGKAIVALQRAEWLAPRDAEIRANLGFVRNQVPGTTLRASHWQSWLGTLTLNEWTWLAVLAFWLTFILLALKQLRPALAARLKNATWICLGLTIFSGAILGVQAAGHFSSATAVVIIAEATARSGPFEDAQSAFTAHNGAELSVLGEHDGWVQVADATGKSGWLSAKQVAVLPGA